MNFTIQHPSNWQVDPESPVGFVRFMLSDRNVPIFVVNIQKVEPYLDTDTMTLQNTSLQQEVQKELDFLSYMDYKVIRQNAVTVGEYAGWKIEYTSDYLYFFEIITIANGNFFTLTYQDDPLKVPENLPLANKMVKTFQVNTENTDSSNGLTFEEYRKKYCPEYSNETQLLVLCSPSELEEPQDMPPPQD